jgi:preprotein translocase subunit SecB
MKAVLQFLQYHVVESCYKYNPFFQGAPVQDAQYSISYRLDINEQDRNAAMISLGVELGDESLTTKPVYVKANIIGLFHIESDELSDEQKEVFFKVNGVAILFPYLRGLVSELTSKGSMNPIILPTMNITALLAELDKNNPKTIQP